MSTKNLENLQMGLVEANFVCIPKSEITLWQARGFEEHRDFPIFLGDLEEDETTMLGIPKTITEFGLEHLIGARIVTISSCLGTYGMGSPGFFGLLCNTTQETVWLTLTIWAAGQYILLDKRVIECHPCYHETYHPWITNRDEDFAKVLENAAITDIFLTDDTCQIELRFSDQTIHQMVIYNYNAALPPFGNGEPRRKAFDTGRLADYMLVTYQDTMLHT